MQRMRKDCILLACTHPLLKSINCSKLILHNIVSWKKHIKHFISDKIFPSHCTVFCFTETHNRDGQYQRINELLPDWDDVHSLEQQGIAICYNTTKVKILKRFTYVGILQMLPLLLDIEGEKLFLITVYRPGGPIGNFVQELITNIDLLREDAAILEECRTLIVGDFNWDQLLPEHRATFNPLCDRYNLHQRSNYSTHSKGGILDLIFDNKKENDVDYIVTGYSDHFTLLVD